MTRVSLLFGALICLLCSNCVADVAPVSGDLRIGFLWPDGTVTLPVALSEETPGVYSGDRGDFAQKQTFLKKYLPKEQPQADLHTLEYCETLTLGPEVAQKLAYQIGDRVTVYLNHRLETVAIKEYCRIAAGCGDDLIGYKIATSDADSSRREKEPVLVAYNAVPLKPFRRIKDEAPDEALVKLVSETTDQVYEDQWYQFSRSDTVYAVLYRGYFKDDKRELLSGCKRVMIRRISGNPVVVHTDERQSIYSELHQAGVEMWYPSLLGFISAVVDYEGEVFFLEKYQRYESSGAHLIRLKNDRMESVLYDGIFLGC